MRPKRALRNLMQSLLQEKQRPLVEAVPVVLLLLLMRMKVGSVCLIQPKSRIRALASHQATRTPAPVVPVVVARLARATVVPRSAPLPARYTRVPENSPKSTTRPAAASTNPAADVLAAASANQHSPPVALVHRSPQQSEGHRRRGRRDQTGSPDTVPQSPPGTG